MTLKTFILSMFISLLGISSLFSQEKHKKNEPQRPKIGLVLSGGAAKGMAHVGVLKVLEKAGIRPDYITGTSMGSIVGGLYSIGYTAQEIEHMLLKQNWNDLLTNNTKLSDININEKKNYGQYIAEFPIQGTEISLPKGLNFGQKIMNLFNYHTLSAAHIRNFDSLPIPFKCNGTDITTGQSVILDTGNLSIAMRASISIPTIFTPILWGDKLLVDGGMSRNFMVQEVKNMGANIIIGSYTGSEVKKKEDFKSMLDIMAQAAFFQGIIDSREQLKMVDLYIQPELSNFTPADFMKARTIINAGEKAALQQYRQLDSIAQILKNYPKQQQLKKLQKQDSLVVKNVIIQGIEKKYTEFVKARMGIFPNEKFHVSELEKGINRVYGSRYFYWAYYGFENDQNGELNLIIYGENKPLGFLGANIHYDSEKRAAMLLNATFRDLLIPATRLSLTANISENPGFQIDYLKYFGKKQQYVAGIQFNNNGFEMPIYTMGNLSQLYKYNYTSAEIYGRYTITNDSRVSCGFAIERTTIKPKVYNNLNFTRWLVNNQQLFASLDINTTDSRYFPQNGIDLTVKYEYNFGLHYDISLKNTTSNFENKTMFNKTFGALKSHLNYYKPIWTKLQAHLFSYAGLTFGENFTLSKQFRAGGTFTAYSYLIPFTGFHELEYSALQIISGGTGLQYEIFSDIFIEPQANLLISANYLEDFFNTKTNEKFILGYGVQIGYASIIGPVLINISSNTYNNKFRAFFNIGYRFRF